MATKVTADLVSRKFRLLGIALSRPAAVFLAASFSESPEVQEAVLVKLKENPREFLY